MPQLASEHTPLLQESAIELTVQQEPMLPYNIYICIAYIHPY